MFTLPYRKSPLHAVIIHIRLSGLKVFTFPIDCLIEVKSGDISCSITQVCKGGNESRETPEPDSRKWQLFPLRHRRHINLAEDKVGEEVVTARPQIPSAQSRGTEYFLSSTVSRTVTQAGSFSTSDKLPISGDSERENLFFFGLYQRVRAVRNQYLFLLSKGSSLRRDKQDKCTRSIGVWTLYK